VDEKGDFREKVPSRVELSGVEPLSQRYFIQALIKLLFYLLTESLPLRNSTIAAMQIFYKDTPIIRKGVIYN
jgi:hypothetical protein